MCGYKEKVKKNDQLTFGCDAYGNGVEITTELSYTILSLCEVEVYAESYGKLCQTNDPLVSLPQKLLKIFISF